MKSRRRRSQAAPFRDGIALYDPRREGSLLESSYAARSVGESLERACALGADALAVTVFASKGSPEPALVRLRERGVHGSASDVALASTLAEARRLDLRTLLAVEPLSSPGGTWGDGLVMTDVEKFDRFFDVFDDIALHYALLARLCGIEILCLGTASRTLVWDEGASDTVLREAALARWRELIAGVRDVFDGSLTYAASARDELDQIGFWRDLDYIGIAMYPSFVNAKIPEDDRPVRGIMRREIGRAFEFSELWERPMLFTQIGFPSKSGGWRRAYAAPGELDLEEQRRFFSLLADILPRMRRQGVLRGLYVWRWSADPGAGGAQDTGLTPQNKPAEAELVRLFEGP